MTLKDNGDWNILRRDNSIRMKAVTNVLLKNSKSQEKNVVTMFVNHNN